MSTFKLTIAYDGTDLIGWQRQADGMSVQGLLEDALRELDGRDVAVVGAGRTDAGVHAIGQVASCSLARDIDAGVLLRALNAHLPVTVRVLRAEPALPNFHARFDAISKHYRYRLWNGPAVPPFERLYVWHLLGPLDLDAMNDAAKRLEGTHDFAAFQWTGSSVATTTRQITMSRLTAGPTGIAEEKLYGRLISYDVAADGFLRHMVRTIVGTLVDIGLGRKPPAWMDDVLASRDRRSAWQTAPASGLVLAAVDYRHSLATDA